MITPRQVQARLQQPPDLDATVWRYLTLPRFIWLLVKEQLWMTRLDHMNTMDRFEGFAPPTISHEFTKSADLSAYGVDSSVDRKDALHQIRQRIFVSCWHLSPHESDAMWRAYCPSGGVAVRTTYRKLAASVGGLPIGLVQYVDFGRYRGPYDPVLGTWLKRLSFAADQEVRIAMFAGWIPSPPHRDETQPYLSLPIGWPLASTVDQIYVYPGADYSYIEALTELVDRLVPGLSQPRVAYSSLAHGPG